MKKNGLIKKENFNSEIYDILTWEANNFEIHILPNISKSKGNQTMNFGQLIEYSMRKNLLEKSQNVV